MNAAARKYREVHASWDKGKVTIGERMYIMQQNVLDFISKCEEWDDVPNFRRFLNEHEEWDSPEWQDAAEAEFNRVKEMSK